MVGPAFHLNFHAGKGSCADPCSLVLAKSQPDRNFYLVFFYQLLLQRAPTTSDIQDAGGAIGARLLNVVLEFPLLSCFERVRLCVVHGARVTTFAVARSFRDSSSTALRNCSTASSKRRRSNS